MIADLSSEDIVGSVPLMLAIASAKIIIFAIAMALGMLTTRKPRGSCGPGIVRGALYAIFCTQSDDIALGVPVIGALLPGHTCPLYVLSAMQAVLFNPAAYVLLGLGHSRARSNSALVAASSTSTSAGGGAGATGRR